MTRRDRVTSQASAAIQFAPSAGQTATPGRNASIERRAPFAIRTWDTAPNAATVYHGRRIGHYLALLKIEKHGCAEVGGPILFPPFQDVCLLF